jgi:3-oxoacyl-[acyl-carrier protein] reductase
MTRPGCALVTGGSRGIGAAVAQRVAAQGWPVGVTFRSDASGAAQVVAAVSESGGQARAHQADVRDTEAMDACVEALRAEFGPVLVLVNNAGVRADGLAMTITDEAWRDVLDTNLGAAFSLMRSVLTDMIRARFGRVVNVSSVAGVRSSPGQANYSAAKAGLIGLTRTAAVEVARRGVTVNAVAPGLIATAMTADVDPALTRMVPARRMGSPEDVAACVDFLVSDSAAYVTGHTLVVDGGLSA